MDDIDIRSDSETLRSVSIDQEEAYIMDIDSSGPLLHIQERALLGFTSERSVADWLLMSD